MSLLIQFTLCCHLYTPEISEYTSNVAHALLLLLLHLHVSLHEAVYLPLIEVYVIKTSFTKERQLPYSKITSSKSDQYETN